MDKLLCIKFFICFYYFLLDEHCIHEISYEAEDNSTTFYTLKQNIFGITNWEYISYINDCSNSLIILNNTLIFPFIYNSNGKCTTNIPIKNLLYINNLQMTIMITHEIGHDITLKRIQNVGFLVKSIINPLIINVQNPLIFQLEIYLQVIQRCVLLPKYIIDQNQKIWTLISNINSATMVCNIGENTIGLYQSEIFYMFNPTSTLLKSSIHTYVINKIGSTCNYDKIPCLLDDISINYKRVLDKQRRLDDYVSPPNMMTGLWISFFAVVMLICIFITIYVKVKYKKN